MVNQETDFPETHNWSQHQKKKKIQIVISSWIICQDKPFARNGKLLDTTNHPILITPSLFVWIDLMSLELNYKT